MFITAVNRVIRFILIKLHHVRRVLNSKHKNDVNNDEEEGWLMKLPRINGR